jgi:hypothetical protein
MTAWHIWTQAGHVSGNGREHERLQGASFLNHSRLAGPYGCSGRRHAKATAGFAAWDNQWVVEGRRACLAPCRQTSPLNIQDKNTFKAMQLLEAGVVLPLPLSWIMPANGEPLMQTRNSQADTGPGYVSVFFPIPRAIQWSHPSPGRKKNKKARRMSLLYHDFQRVHDTPILGGNVTALLADTVRYLPFLPKLTGSLALPQKFFGRCLPLHSSLFSGKEKARRHRLRQSLLFWPNAHPHDNVT